jgi:TP901 family phage tail tape measure protein
MAETRQLDLVLNLQDKASKELTGLSGKLQKLQPAFKKMAMVGTASFLAIGAGIGKAVMEASRFDTAMSNVSTLLDTNVENMEDMKKEVLALSKTLPVPLEELSASLYDIRSAGISASEAMGVLEASAKLSSAGLSTAQESTDILTSAINSFKKEGLSASEISDMLFKTVKAGKTTISELAMTFGASAPVIADAGVKLADFQSATASLTTTGLPASQAQMGLRQAIVALIKPTGDMEKIFDGLGMTGRELITDSDNMGEAFKKIREEAKKQGVSFEKAIGSVEALNAVIGITDTTSESYIDTLASMTDGTNQIDEAYKKQLETFAAQTQVVKNQIGALAITLGTQFIPIIQSAVEKITPIIEKLASWIEQHPELAGLVAVFGALGLILPPIIAGIGLILSPVGLVIIAIIALIATGVLLWKNWDKIWGWITAKTESEIDKVKTIFNFFKSYLSSFVEFWKGIGEGIGNIWSSVWGGVVGVFKASINWIVDGINKFIGGLNRIQVPDWVAGIGGKGINIPEIPRLATGTNYVPQDTLAYLHKGEAVVPKKYNNQGAGGITININGGTYLDRNAGEQLAELLAENLRSKLRI